MVFEKSLLNHRRAGGAAVRRTAYRLTSGICLALCLAGAAGSAAQGATTASAEAADYNAVGVEHYAAGRWQEAITSFERAYDLARDNETVRRNLCNAHQAEANDLAKVADYAAAAKHLEIAISVAPENPSPLLQLGSYYLRLDMVRDAIFRLEEAVELAPDNLDANELLGDAYYKDNDVASARANWEWVLQMDPNRPDLRSKIEKASREEAVEKDYRRSDSRHFALSFPPGTPSRSLSRLLEHLERAYLEIGRDFGRVFPPGPIQVIVYNSKGFTDVTQLGEHVGALFDGKIRIPLVDMAGDVLDDDELKRRLYHEYTHVVVRYLAADNVPWWLNEGLAETFSRPLGAEQTALLEQVYAQGKAFSLTDLEGEQLKRLDVTALRVAYYQSHATAELLWSRFGPRLLRQLMSSLAEGVPPEEALLANLRYDYARLEKEVAQRFGQTGRLGL